MNARLGRRLGVLTAWVFLGGSSVLGGEASAIRVQAEGSAAVITGPEGFGEWYLHFPETMLLEGPPQGKAEKMTKTVADDGTISLEGKMEGPMAHWIRITYKPGRSTIDVTLEVKNLSGKAWRYGGEAMACLQPFKAPGFEDDRGRRTLVEYQGKLQSIAAIAASLNREVGPTDTVSCPVQGEEMAPQQAQYHAGSWTLDCEPIARVSKDGSRLVGVAWDRVHRVSMNFTHSCIHSNPRVTALEPGASCRRTGRIYFLAGSPDDFRKRYREDFPRK